METGINLKRVILAVLLIAAAAVSFFVFGRMFSSPDAYSDKIESIDDKVETTLKLTASATASSAGITVLPDDIGTPIAERLADFSEYGFIVLCILYAEKYLMSILGEMVFCYILPGVFLLFAITLFIRSRRIPRLLIKIAVVSLALWITIPLSIHISDKIYDTYTVSINQTIDDAQQLSDDTAQLQEAGDDQNALQRILGALKTTSSDIADRGAQLINKFIESMAIMVVTSCLIPLLVLFLSLWLIRQILGFDIPIPKPKRAKLMRHGLPGSQLK